MAEAWRSASPLDGFAAPPPAGEQGVTVQELRRLAVTMLHGPAMLLPGLPQRPGAARLAAGTALWMAPGQWLLLHAPDAPPPVPAAQRTALGGSRCILEVAGPRAGEALATLLPIDLHPRVFGEDAAAATVAAHVPVLLWREGAAFRLACYRSYGMALAEALVAAGRGRGLHWLPAA